LLIARAILMNNILSFQKNAGLFVSFEQVANRKSLFARMGRKERERKLLGLFAKKRRTLAATGEVLRIESSIWRILWYPFLILYYSHWLRTTHLKLFCYYNNALNSLEVGILNRAAAAALEFYFNAFYMLFSLKIMYFFNKVVEEHLVFLLNYKINNVLPRGSKMGVTFSNPLFSLPRAVFHSLGIFFSPRAKPSRKKKKPREWKTALRARKRVQKNTHFLALERNIYSSE